MKITNWIYEKLVVRCEQCNTPKQIKEYCPKCEPQANSLGQIDAEVRQGVPSADDFARKIEDKFTKMMQGRNYTNEEEYIVNATLAAYYKIGLQYGLDEVTNLKHCCCGLQETLDKILNEAKNKMLGQNSA